MLYSPIVLFVYNRPLHTEKTLVALSNNNLAKHSELYIFSDGPKDGISENDLKNINEVRKLIRQKQWCGKVHIFEQLINKGLAQSIIKGVTSIINKYGRVIVLEDDIVTSPKFLEYMNNALEFYKDEKRIFQISGFMVPHSKKLPDYFFYRAPGSWGWATWKRAWDSYNHNTSQLINEIPLSQVYRFNIDNTYPYYNHLQLNNSGSMNTWAVRWYASFFIQNGLCVWPAKSYVRNIGHDGSGENCGERKEHFLNQSLNYKSTRFTKKEIKESIRCLELLKSYYSNTPLFLRNMKKNNLRFEIKNKIRRVLKKIFNNNGK